VGGGVGCLAGAIAGVVVGEWAFIPLNFAETAALGITVLAAWLFDIVEKPERLPHRYSFALRNLSAWVITETELRLMAVGGADKKAAVGVGRGK
jgi:hypothetical protein